MPRVRITETSPIKVRVCSDKDKPPQAGAPEWKRYPEWDRQLGSIRDFSSVNWEATAERRATVWRDPDTGQVAGIEIDLVTI